MRIPGDESNLYYILQKGGPMKIDIQSLHFDADKKLLDFISEKVNKLNQYFDGIIACEVTLRVEKSENTENKLAEIKLEIPGNDLFAKKQCKTFEEATDASVSALRKQLTKHKEKVRGV